MAWFYKYVNYGSERQSDHIDNDADEEIPLLKSPENHPNQKEASEALSPHQDEYEALPYSQDEKTVGNPPQDEKTAGNIEGESRM